MHVLFQFIQIVDVSHFSSKFDAVQKEMSDTQRERIG